MINFQLLPKFILAFVVVILVSVSASAQQTITKSLYQTDVELKQNAITPVYNQDANAQRNSTIGKQKITKLQSTIVSTEESDYTGNERTTDQLESKKVKRNPWTTTLPIQVIEQTDNK